MALLMLRKLGLARCERSTAVHNGHKSTQVRFALFFLSFFFFFFFCVCVTGDTFYMDF